MIFFVFFNWHFQLASCDDHGTGTMILAEVSVIEEEKKRTGEEKFMDSSIVFWFLIHLDSDLILIVGRRRFVDLNSMIYSI